MYKKGEVALSGSLAPLTEHTAKMMTVTCLLLSSIWIAVPGNSLVCLGVCVIILTALGTSVAVPASFCAAGCWSPHPASSWGKPSGDTALVALYDLPEAQACHCWLHWQHPLLNLAPVHL